MMARWKRWFEDPQFLPFLVPIKTVLVVLLLLALWALRDKDVTVVYLRF
jgi:hypothetical protein